MTCPRHYGHDEDDCSDCHLVADACMAVALPNSMGKAAWGRVANAGAGDRRRVGKWIVGRIRLAAGAAHAPKPDTRQVKIMGVNLEAEILRAILLPKDQETMYFALEHGRLKTGMLPSTCPLDLAKIYDVTGQKWVAFTPGRDGDPTREAAKRIAIQVREAAKA